ncbi:uncharacterized protein LOC103874380 [Brassica rapa]|uniref:uncharacterized protein LOC103874380 n=1 Tax=Brassica campestris TaxID=3711 RepID=UPI00142DBFCA|nr:uncharacterized protein LOC103874380 [Brassica rapa]
MGFDFNDDIGNKRVCKSIARIMALALDLDVNYFDTPDMLGNPIADMILFHYEGVFNPSKGIYACGAHCDFGMLSLLATDDVMGLQLIKVKVFSSQIPFFVKPSHDCIIECLPTCQSENNPPKYPAIKCSTYLSQHYKAAHAHHKQT